MMDEPRVRLMLVDDHEVVRVELASLLSTIESFSVVGEARCVAKAVAEARRCLPDVALRNLELPSFIDTDAILARL